jgi:YesN/AraC family two-component response regulator
MRKGRNISQKFIGRALYLFGLMDGVKKKEGPSSFNAESILLKANNAMRSEELYRSADLTITQLARKTGTNRTYLSKCFRLHNTNYVDYVNEFRVKLAKSLIENKANENKSITEISELSGFPNPRSFSKCFYNKYGKTPSHFKREVLARATLPRF